MRAYLLVCGMCFCSWSVLTAAARNNRNFWRTAVSSLNTKLNVLARRNGVVPAGRGCSVGIISA